MNQPLWSPGDRVRWTPAGTGLPGTTGVVVAIRTRHDEFLYDIAVHRDDTFTGHVTQLPESMLHAHTR